MPKDACEQAEAEQWHRSANFIRNGGQKTNQRHSSANYAALCARAPVLGRSGAAPETHARGLLFRHAVLSAVGGFRLRR